MGFTSLSFLVFFPIIWLIYLAIPPKARILWLLAASYAFCWSFGFNNVLVLLASTAVTYGVGVGLEAHREGQGRRVLLAGAVLLHVMFLFFVKYNRANFFIPIGISFYTCQAVGYLVDVYRGRAAEHHVIRFALFQAFFPKLVQGPIEQSGNLLEQIRHLDEKDIRNLDSIRSGALLLLWGLFQKLMIADRLAVPVNAVFGQFGAFGGVEILLATLIYAFQIYCDFAGYTNIARGAAKMCGIDLLENFRRPFLSESVQDFWRRWHITLGSWLREYVYIPLGGNRKGKLWKQINILITFTLSGVWHGVGVHYLLWGVLQGVGQLVDIASWKIPKVLKQIIVFLFFDATLMVFRVNSLGDLRGMLKILATDFRLRDFAGMQLGGLEWLLALLGIILVLAKDIFNDRGVSFQKKILEGPAVVRCLIYTAMIGGIVIFGVYGAAYDTSGFLYTQF